MGGQCPMKPLADQCPMKNLGPSCNILSRFRIRIFYRKEKSDDLHYIFPQRHLGEN